MSEQSPILGYRADGTPIRETPRGAITTQAFIHCSKCGHAIKTTGGPAIGACCVECAKSDGHE